MKTTRKSMCAITGLLTLALSSASASEPPKKSRCTGEHPSWRAYKAAREEADAMIAQGKIVLFCQPPFVGPESVRGSNGTPALPETARGACVHGLVVVQAIISEDGSARETEVLVERPDTLGFGVAAVEAVKTWRFEPARWRENGCPVSVYHTVVVEFPADCPR